jgi:hypothetical protein
MKDLFLGVFTFQVADPPVGCLHGYK